MVPIKDPAVPVPDDAIIALCVGTASHAASQHTLFGIVWAPGLVCEGAMYRSFSPELFWSIASRFSLHPCTLV